MKSETTDPIPAQFPNFPSVKSPSSLSTPPMRTDPELWVLPFLVSPPSHPLHFVTDDDSCTTSQL